MSKKKRRQQREGKLQQFLPLGLMASHDVIVLQNTTTGRGLGIGERAATTAEIHKHNRVIAMSMYYTIDIIVTVMCVISWLVRSVKAGTIHTSGISDT